MLFYLQELCSVGATLAVTTPCAFTVICRTRCSIEEMPAGSVAIMLKLLTYVCVTPSLFRSPIMIVPPVARYVVPVSSPVPVIPCGWNCRIVFPFAVVVTILRVPDRSIFSAVSHPGPVGVNSSSKGTLVLVAAYAFPIVGYILTVPKIKTVATNTLPNRDLFLIIFSYNSST